MLKRKQLLFFLAVLILTACTDSKQGHTKNHNLNHIKLVIESDEAFGEIENSYEKPGDGKIFRSFLISIENSSNYNLYGGSSDYHSTFSVTTSDGYVIKAINTSSSAWRENRLVWSVEVIPEGQLRKGWIVFSVPIDNDLKTLTFNVDERHSPHHLTGLGAIEVPIK